MDQLEAVLDVAYQVAPPIHIEDIRETATSKTVELMTEFYNCLVTYNKLADSYMIRCFPKLNIADTDTLPVVDFAEDRINGNSFEVFVHTYAHRNITVDQYIMHLERQVDALEQIQAIQSYIQNHTPIKFSEKHYK